MRLLVFGATGGTGRELVNQALTNGHVVTAFARNPDSVGVSHGRLQVAKGDALDAAAVERAMPGHDAVLCTLGASAMRAGTIRSEGTRNIVRAMERIGVRRLVCQTSLGYGDSRKVLHRAPLHFRYLVAPLLLRQTFADHERQEDLIKRSALGWIIVRPGILTDGPQTGAYKHGFPADDPSINVEVSRADVAEFMLRQLAEDTYLHKTPGISR